MTCRHNCKNNCIRNYDKTVRRGETFEISGKTTDPLVSTITLKVWDDTGEKLSKTASFVDGIAVINCGIMQLPAKEYYYSLTVLYSDSTIDILPDPEEQCSGSPDCSFPKLIVCKGGYNG